jgi:hypothetical protein
VSPRVWFGPTPKIRTHAAEVDRDRPSNSTSGARSLRGDRRAGAGVPGSRSGAQVAQAMRVEDDAIFASAGNAFAPRSCSG